MKKKMTHTDKTSDGKKDRLVQKSKNGGKFTKENVIRRGKQSENVKDIRRENMKSAKKIVKDTNYSDGRVVDDELTLYYNRQEDPKEAKKMMMAADDPTTKAVMDFDKRQSKTVKTKSASPNKLDFLKHKTINKLEGR